MDKKIIIANWKSNKVGSEAHIFLEGLLKEINKLNLGNKQIILAPSFQLISHCKEFIDKYNLPVRLSAQNVSTFGQGAFTGEVNADQVKEFCEDVIIGHSERRTLLNESDDALVKKVNEAKKSGLRVIYCVQNSSQKIPTGVDIVAYEPPSAIGSGEPDSPANVEKVFNEIKERFDGKVLYGGSITAQNVRDYIHIKSCGGLLVGGVSLKIESFIDLLSQW